MVEKIPAGWGFSELPVVPPGKPGRKPRADSDRIKHMRFALWASRLRHLPKPGEVCDTFGICYESARRLVNDWEILKQEMKK